MFDSIKHFFSRKNKPSGPASAQPTSPTNTRNPGVRPISKEYIKFLQENALPAFPNIRWEKILGNGSFGVVFLARDQNQNIDLAIKKVRPDRIASMGSDLFREECNTWLNLDVHPSIVNCYYVRTYENVPYIFMEYIEGSSLRDCILRGQIREIKLLLQIAFQVAIGIDYIHSKKIIHQDIKPGNILIEQVDGSPNAKITDFTTASVIVRDEQYGPYRGCTHAYAAPEALAQEEWITPKVDLWSWAVTVLQMFTGTVNWENGSMAGEYLERSYQPGQDNPEWLVPMPHSVFELLMECFQRVPEARPADMKWVTERVKAILQEQTGMEADQIEEAKALQADEILISAVNYNNQGVSYWNIGKYREALAAFQRALDADPDYLTALFNYSMILWLVGFLPNDVSFIKTLQNRLQDQPGDWYIHYLIGRANLYRKNAEQAIEAFQKSIDLNPNTPTTLSYITEAEGLIKDIERRRERFTHKVRELSSEGREINCVVLSLDGSRIITSGMKKGFTLWDLNTGTPTELWDGAGEYTGAACFSQDSRRAVLSNSKGTVVIWDLQENRGLNTIQIETGKDSYLGRLNIAFLLDPNLIVASYDIFHENRIVNLCIWNIQTGECLHREQNAHSEEIFSLKVSQDGSRVITASRDNTAKLWLLKDGCRDMECIFTYDRDPENLQENLPNNEREFIGYADIDSVNEILLTGNRDASIDLCDISSGEVKRTLYGHTEHVNAVHWMPGSSFAVSNTSREFKIWDIEAGVCLLTIGGEWNHNASSYSPASNKIAFVTPSHAVEIWDLGIVAHTQPRLMIQNIRRAMDIFSVTKDIQPMKKQIETFIRQQDYDSAYGVIREIKSRHQEYKHHSIIRRLEDTIDQVAKKSGVDEIWYDNMFSWQDRELGSSLSTIDIAPDDNTLIAGSHDGIVIIGEISSKQIKGLLHTRSNTNCIRFTDNNHMLRGLRAPRIEYWDIENLEMIDSFDDENRFVGFNDLEYEPRNKLVMTTIGSILGWKLIVFELDSRAVVFQREYPGLLAGGGLSLSSGLSAICFSEDGQHIILSERSGQMEVWNIRQNKLVATFEGHGNSVLYAGFYNSDSRAVSVEDGQIIRFWDVKLGYCLHSIDYPSAKLEAACMTSDRNYLISLDDENSICIWSLNDYECKYQCKPNVQIKLSLIAISKNGRHLITGGEDRTVCLFGIDWKYEFPKKAATGEDAINRLILPDGSEIEPSLSCGHSSDISALASAGFKYLISGSHDRTIRIWDLFQGNVCVQTLRGHTGRIGVILPTSDQKEIVSGDDDGNVFIWDLNSGLVRLKIQRESKINALQVTKDNQFLIVGCANGIIHCQDFKSGGEVAQIKLESSITSLLVTPDGETLCAGTEHGSSFIFQVRGWEQRKELPHDSSVVRILYNQDALYIGHASGEIEVVNPVSLEVTTTLSSFHGFTDFLVQGKHIVIYKYNLNNSAAYILNADSGEEEFRVDRIGWMRALTTYTYGYFFIGLSYGHIAMVETTTGKLSGFLLGQDDTLQCVKLSSDNRYVITGHYDRFRIYDLHSGALSEFEDDKNIIDVDFSVDNRFAYAQNYYGKIYKVDLATRQVVMMYQDGELGNVNSLTMTAIMDEDTFEHTHMILSARGVAGIATFEIVSIGASREELASSISEKEIEGFLNKSKIRYSVHGNLRSKGFRSIHEVTFLDMREKGEQINFNFMQNSGTDAIGEAMIAWNTGLVVATTIMGQIRVYDIKTQALIREFKDNEQEYNQACFTLYNENILITGCNNGKIKLWNFHTGTQIAGFAAHEGPVACLSVSADGKLIISGSRSDGIRIWAFETLAPVVTITKAGQQSYGVFTPQNDFFVSDAKYLQFYRKAAVDGITQRTLVRDEAERATYIRHFNDIQKVRARIESITESGPQSIRNGGPHAKPR